jgi:TolA-binding protein
MKLLIASVFLTLSALSGLAQTCAPPPIVANARSTNMFSPEQEMILGELTVQQLASEFRQVNDPG